MVLSREEALRYLQMSNGGYELTTAAAIRLVQVLI